ncbi:hypothetical protein PAXRUDRAFT_148392 [Paxillus rubicundulus Ve08.2h10]|uniref:HAT C-terminal dimerisation domain-containing protein n=1 Tax=Paxillus rubicundulus Ve08.2h10 TaxID=930991 RepID=A0A0D0E454_9AGAM|nr:hypothetical protein PAXRUDRAFT_148392 [Paxillus rubicundulus Ve08.2h10]
MAWGGPEEQKREQAAGNPNDKDWCDKALKIIETTMEEYWNDDPITRKDTSKSTCGSGHKAQQGQHRKTATQGDPGGWKAELCCYLSDMPVDVSKDTDIIAWWSSHSMIYLTLSQIAMDVCAIPTTSVPCERLFSAGAEIVTDCHSRLGGEKLECLEVLEHAWRDKVTDHAAANSTKINEVYLEDFRELLRTDNELAEWDKVDEVITL